MIRQHFYRENLRLRDKIFALDFQLIFTYNNGFRVNLIESDIRFLLHKSFKEHNIEIPFPQRVVHLEK